VSRARAACPPLPEPLDSANPRDGPTAGPVGPGRRGALPMLGRLDAVREWLEELGHALDAEGSARSGTAVEWLLDNAYLLQRVLARIEHDLPPGFQRRLPVLLTGGQAGQPRVLALAREAVAGAELRLDGTSLASFVDGWQRTAPLDIGELWALPTLLRLALLEALVAALREAFPEQPPPPGFARAPAGLEHAPTDLVVPSAVRAIRALENIDWRRFFEAHSEVERRLREDPSGDYAAADFDTRDRCCKVIEEIARRSGRTESDLAAAAIALAATRAQGSREAHVGYFLLDEGRFELERGAGARPSLGDRFRRALLRHATPTYLGALAAGTGVALLLPGLYLAARAAPAWALVAGCVLAALPASAVALAATNFLVTRLLPPRRLPRLDFSEGIPEEFRAAVVIPTLLASVEDARHLTRRIELHYLGNADPALAFVLLTDFVDADQALRPEDTHALEHLRAGIADLNARHSREGRGPFHLLHRERRWNEAEGCWMGWERKRGKLEELGRLLAGARDTSYVVHEGEPAGLAGVRYVITLDTDTRLPRGGAARLVGILAHPLNRAAFDEQTGRVRAGYTVIQPRAGITPESSSATLFARIFSTDTAIDVYSRAVSDVYQDLFGAGLFVGKGIYDWRAFERSLRGRAPQNALASHDMFEGLHGRVGLASDQVVYEEYPAGYLAYARRLHRWIRGDWQLLPWLLPRVPAADGGKLPNCFTAIGRWNIFDNLRRSLLAPSLVLLLVAGWIWLPGSPWFWTLLALATPAAHLVGDLAGATLRLLQPRQLRSRMSAGVQRAGEELGRWLLHVAFLPHEARVACDAAARTLVRIFVTRRRLLEWSAAAQTSRRLAASAGRAREWLAMAESPLAALALGVLVALTRPESLPAALPVLGLWAASPGLARRVSHPLPERVERIAPEHAAALRRLARRTWLFYEMLVGPADHWLPPDNFQEHPLGEVAHRTSPTNIGMLFTSTLAAYDFGYIGPSELAIRLRSALDTTGVLERYRGHLLNWYDTRSLEPLLPRYVSSVDSGNLAASLVLVQQGCADAVRAPVLRLARWEGLLDTAQLALESARAHATRAPGRESRALLASVKALRDGVRAALVAPGRWLTAAEELTTGALYRCRAELLGHVEPAEGAEQIEIERWVDRARFQLQSLREDLAGLLAPVTVLAACPVPDLDAAATAALRRLLPAALTLDAIPGACCAARDVLAQLAARIEHADDGRPMRAWSEQMQRALARAEQEAGALRDALLTLGVRMGEEVRTTDFRALYDEGRRLFFIGRNLSTNEVDPHHYDLLASEARLTSFLAIAKGDVPLEHWFQLGRPMTRVGRSAVLLSWSATMFEYLMPRLWLDAPRGSLLSQSARAAVEHQIRYATSRGVPWGISESCYHGLDANKHYQYRAFGVPGLGFKRGLEDDLVVAPYASLLAADLAPRRVMKNLDRLLQLDMLGTYGLYEAIDFTPARVPVGARAGRVRAYMAHHQGMILMALANGLVGGSMRQRFAASALVQTSLALLYEEVPRGVRPERMRARDVELEAPLPRPAPTPVAWRPELEGALPEVHLLGNGRLSTLVSASGAGWLLWKGLSITRWTPDATSDDHGLWIYVRDEETGELVSITRQPTHAQADSADVSFTLHGARFERRGAGLEASLAITVAPSEDVEARLVTLTDLQGRARRLAVFTGAELALGDPREVERHPAFARLFVSCTSRPAERALLVQRRSRALDEPGLALVHRLVADDDAVGLGGWQTDRREFLGRGGRWAAPRAAHSMVPAAGEPLDPLLSLCATVELAPHASARLAFTTAFAASADEALALSSRFGSLARIDWLAQDAEREARDAVPAVGVDPARLPEVQRLLSLLLHPFGALRAPAESLAAARGGRRPLWAHGVSGDLPILLLHQSGSDDLELFGELLAAQRLWRERGARVDLVVIAGGASSYEDTTGERLHRVLVGAGAEGWIARSGGVYIVRGDQSPAEERAALEAAAAVVLDARAGGLAAVNLRLGRRADVPASFAPVREAGEPTETTPVAEPGSELVGRNGLGGFTPDGREYVVELAPGASTPAPWCNVLANERFGCLVAESGLGCTWSQNSGEHRLTPWSNDPVVDRPAEVLYLRDEEDGRAWTTTPLPIVSQGAVRVHHGAGISTFHRTSRGLRQRLSVFVPPDCTLKVVELELENLWPRARRLTATYYAEWVLGTTRAANAPHIVPAVAEELGALFAQNPWSDDFEGRVAFLAASERPHGFTTDRTEFLGREGELADPAALGRWGLSGRVEAGLDPCAALQVHLELERGERRRVWFVLGEEQDREQAEATIRSARRASWVDDARRALEQRWDELLGTLRIETPQPALDRFVNRFGILQVLSGRVWARTALYQSSGAFGFRDQLQDVLALLHVAPRIARGHLLECARRQFAEGDVLHWWHPPAGRGVRTRCSDDLAWLPYVTSAYVEATGDVGVLEEEVAYLAGAPLADDEPQRYGSFEPGAERASLLDHCRRALARAFTRGPHGLPLMGDHDWNDAMNRVGHLGRGESVWLGWFLCTCAQGFARLCERVGEAGEADQWRERARELARSLERSAWDGDWYLRGFFDDGTPLGSQRSEECRIDSIAQSWSVLAGLADPERAARATDAAERLLVGGEPPVARLFTPPFERAEPDPGYIRGYPPGVRENGGQYTHAAAWLALALVRRGEPDRALRIVQACLGETHAADRTGAEHYRVEPYVIAADVYADGRHHGRGGWTWYTGSAAWVWRVVVEGFLGLRAVEGALEVAPCLPSTWRHVRAQVRVGRALYDIAIEAPDGLGPGRARVELDGRLLDPPRLPRGAEERTHAVRVTAFAPQARTRSSPLP